MRKLILIAVIATMSTTSCYANLSLASNEPAPAASAQPKQAETAPKAVVKSSTAAKPRRRHSGGGIYSVYSVGSFYRGCL